LNRLELSKLAPTRYHKISHNPVAIKNLLVDLFVMAHERAPRQIILDLDATDDPLHGEQEGRFFHGYYDCYCYLLLYMFCGRHLLVAKLPSAAMDAAATGSGFVPRRLRHSPLAEQDRGYNTSVLRGHYGYFAMPHSWRPLNGSSGKYGA
jgi:hypothetical protein